MDAGQNFLALNSDDDRLFFWGRLPSSIPGGNGIGGSPQFSDGQDGRVGLGLCAMGSSVAGRSP